LFPGTSQYSDQAPPEGLNIKVLINSINPFNWIKIGNRLRKEKPDLIVVRYWLPFMGPCFGTILRIAKKNKHSKVVCIADNVIPHEKRFGDRMFTTYFIEPVDAFISMSEKVLADLRLFNTKKPAQFVPHPLYDNFGEKVSQQEARQYLNIPLQQPLILFFGFIRKYKGLDILLHSMALLQQKMPTLQLLIAGEYYEDKKDYEALISELGISNQLLIHTHFIADNEIKYYMCAADLVVQPYRNATQSGVTPLAYHFEIPMLVTDVGGLAAMVPNGKVGLVASPNAESIAEKIELFFETGASPYLPHIVDEKKKYSWHNMVKAILDSP
jgi:glycosyltransferase involved in cell wall biosynthesis